MTAILFIDFWAAYIALACGDRRFYLAHLLRKLEKVWTEQHLRGVVCLLQEGQTPLEIQI